MADGFALVRDFYSAHPFPAYGLEKYAVRDDLYRHANPYTLLLDAHLPRDARVLDLGCGTGQLANLLALRGRRVVGVDFSETSLAYAERLRARLAIETCTFRLADLTQLVPAPGETYDAILCNGVAPCLPSPDVVLPRLWRAFAHPGTLIVIGLYHAWGRLAFRLRRRLGDRSSVDAMLVKREKDAAKVASWIADQCTPPVERCHRIADVRRWFESAGILWLRSLPSLPGDPASRHGLFPPASSRRRRVLAAVAEGAWIWRLRDSGGYFVCLGRTP